MEAEKRRAQAPRNDAPADGTGADAPGTRGDADAAAVFVFGVEGRGGGSLDARVTALNGPARSLARLGESGSGAIPLEGVFSARSAIEVLGHLRRAVASGEPHRAIVRLVSHGGDVSGEASFTPVQDRGGAVSNVVMVAPATSAYPEPNREAGHVPVDTGTVGSFRLEPVLGNAFVSSELARILGVQPEEALGRGWLSAVHADDRSRVSDAVEEAERNAARLDLLCRITRPGGAERWIRIRAVPLVGDVGAVTGLVGTVEDVTVRREEEERAARFASTIEATPDLVTYHDHTGRVVYVNAAAREFFGLGADEVLREMYPRDMLEPPPGGIGVMQETIAREGRWQGEIVMLGAGGHRMDASAVIVGHHDRAGRIEYFAGVARDITEQRRAENARRRSEATLRTVVQHSPLGIQVVDAAGRVQLWNRACEEIYGWSADEVIGGPVPFVTEESADEFEALRARVLAGETLEGEEACRVRKDGSPVYLSVFAAPLRDATGRAIATVAVVADITARVDAQRVLLEREQLMRALVESASDIISIVEADGTIRYSSRVSERMLGYEEGSAPGLKIFDIIHPDEVDEVRRLWADRLRHPGFESPIETRILRADGKWLETEVVANNLLDDPVVHGIVLTTRDISERKAAEETLRRRDDRFRSLVQNLAEAIVVVSEDGEILFNTPTSAAMFGDPEPDGAGLNISQFMENLHPDDRDTASAALASAWVEPGTVGPLEGRIRHADGHWVRVEALAQNLIDDPSVGGVVVTMRDVTERRNAEDLNAMQARILEMVARGVSLDDTLDAIALSIEKLDSNLRCAVYLFDETRTALCLRAAPSLPGSFANAMTQARVGPEGCLFGVSMRHRAPSRVRDISREPGCEGCAELASENKLRACWSTPLVSRAEEESLGVLAIGAEATGDPTPAQERMMAVFADLAVIAIERKRYEERISHQSLHDPLTSLPNRALFLDRLGHAIERCRRTRSEVGVLFMDLDRFKLVNDSLGHDAGDELLVAVSQRLMGTVRPGDTVARFGGDEFTVLCEDLPVASSGDRASEIAQRLFDAIAEPFALRGTEVFLGASIGIAISADADTRPEDLLRDADAAMYHAKEQGKGRWELFDEAMRERVLARHETENDLHRAIDRNELRLFFQPIISLVDHRCVGAEALVRWQHPERGLVLPGEFIALAEETGIIHDLGRWVLQEAATQAARWQPEAPDDFVVSVNISARQLLQSDLAAIVAEVLARSGARPERICLEITESVLMDDAEATIGLLDRVRALGVRFSIDDFGTGYSSLGYLRQFPVDVVKIDRSFVSDVTSDAGDAAIVSAVVGLAHALGLEVVAEGVETLEQLQAVTALGCDQAQGFYFSPPQPVADLARLFARNRWRPRSGDGRGPGRPHPFTRA